MAQDTNLRQKSYPEIFGERLEMLLKKTKTTKKELAEEIGVTPKTITSWTKGRQQPTLTSFVKIIYFFRDLQKKKRIRILPLHKLAPEIIENEMRYLQNRFFRDLDYYLKNHKK